MRAHPGSKPHGHAAGGGFREAAAWLRPSWRKPYRAFGSLAGNTDVKRLAIVSLLSAALAMSAASQAQSFGMVDAGTRGGNWEAYGGLRMLLGESVEFEGGSIIDTDDDLGFGFGVGYNIDGHWLIGGEMAWYTVDYDGTVVSADIPGSSQRLAGEMETFSLGANVAYHFLEGPLTPYVSASLGYTWIDTNIATGPPQLGCWWDPWWGYVCDYFVDTKEEEEFNYGLGVGLRWQFEAGWFARLGYDHRWLDISNTVDGSPGFGGVHIDIGSRF